MKSKTTVERRRRFGKVQRHPRNRHYQNHRYRYQEEEEEGERERAAQERDRKDCMVKFKVIER